MAATPKPIVQGFTFTETDPIPNIAKLKTNPNPREWSALQEIILANGDKLFNLTKRGKDHPVQTKSLRVDFQGVARDRSCANQQAQLGGTSKYDAGKNESTSFTCVHVDFNCQSMPNINLALQRAHNYSFMMGRVVHLTPDAAAATTAAVPAAAATTSTVQTIVCTNTDCERENVVGAWMKTGTTQYCEHCATSFVVP